MHWNVIFKFCVSALFINSVLELRTWRISMSHLFISCDAMHISIYHRSPVLCFAFMSELSFGVPC